MAEYIDREALRQFPIRKDHYDKKNGNKHFIFGIETVIEYAESLPAADVAPVRHGRWLWNETGELGWEQYYICSNCGDTEYWESKFCPECGAKMDLEE